jgi:osmotically inducible protein OsmC
MPVRNASAQWNGKLRDGNGTMKLGSGAFEGSYSFASRFESGTGTNPEELVGAAHAGCFSMALSGILEKAGYAPDWIRTEARVHLEKAGEGFKITTVELFTEAKVSHIDQATFGAHAEAAKRSCPVSQALRAITIRLEKATLVT